jgi:Uma2 family endonuclease/predicted HTH domain antitoxin
MLKTIQIPDEPVQLLGSDKHFSRALTEAVVLELFQEHRISAGKAAEFLECSYREFLDLLQTKNIPIVTTPPHGPQEVAALCGHAAHRGEDYGRLEQNAMATVLSPPEQRIILRHISWETYERLLAENADSSTPRFTYDRGVLEIMSPSAEHEELSHVLTLLVNVVAEELDIDIRGFGSTTFRSEDLARGFAPDSCFYMQSVERISGKTTLALAVDPPPDLVVEIDLTSSSLDKFPIYAHTGVPEIWRYDGTALRIFHLENAVYVEREESTVLPILTSHKLSQFVADSKSHKRPSWLRRVRHWVQTRGEEDSL